MEDKQVKKIPKSKLDKARKIIESATWIFAKTYSDKAPELLSNVVYDPSGGGSFCYHSIPELNS
jgi:hypothetical protein